MSLRDLRAGSLLSRYKLPLFVFLLSAVVTLLGWLYLHQVELDDAREEFEHKAKLVQESLALRVRSYEQLVRSTAAYFTSSADVTEEEFFAFLDLHHIQETLPGVASVVYAPLVAPAQRRAYEERVRASLGNPAFGIRYAAEEGPSYPATFIYPPARYSELVGLNMGRDEARRRAISSAVERNAPMATSLVRLIVLPGQPAGIAMVAPVYQRGLPLTTLAERQRALRGIVHSSYLQSAIFEGLVPLSSSGSMGLEIRDESGLLFEQPLVVKSSAASGSVFRWNTKMTVGGRAWSLTFTDDPALYSPPSRNTETVWLISGMLASLLLTGLLVQTSARRNADAQRLSAENLALREQQARAVTLEQYDSLFHQNPDIVFSLDLEGRFVSANAAALAFTGAPDEASLLGRHFEPFVMPDDLSRTEAHVEAAARGRAQDYRITAINGAGETRRLHVMNLPIVANGEIIGIYGIAKDITDQQRKEQELIYLAQYDVLTGLANRGLLADRIQHALTMAETTRGKAAVLYLDLDKFKDINDTLGHAGGDLVLRQVAARLKPLMRATETLARTGGDEFTILVEEENAETRAVSLAQAIIEAFAVPFSVAGNELHLSTSIGIALYPHHGRATEDLLVAADMALYTAKAQGRNTWALFQAQMQARASEAISIKSHLVRALERNEFSLHYQPQVNAATGQVVGLEALIRWYNPDLGHVSPVRFIPLAEESGAIVEIGEWVVREACLQHRRWTAAGLPPVRIAVNASARQFTQPDFSHRVRTILAETGMDPRYLEIEATESMLMQDISMSMRVLHELKSQGLLISIDDFGTGYSSLSYLVHFPLDILKIDRSFINNVTTSHNDALVAETIISLAHSLNLKIIAEGVETREQLAFLRERRCEAAQGYLFCRPVPPEEAAIILGQGCIIR